MVGSIHPVVGGEVRKARWVAAVALFAAAAALTAAVFGLAVSTAGAPLRSLLDTSASVVLVFVLSLAYAVHELTGLPLPRPQRRRQVPSAWRAWYPQWLSATMYGAYLGPGVLTYVFSSSYYVLLAVCALMLEPVPAAALMAIYGAAKGASILFTGWRVASFDELYRVGTAIPRTGVHGHRVNGLALLAVAAAHQLGPLLTG